MRAELCCERVQSEKSIDERQSSSREERRGSRLTRERVWTPAEDAHLEHGISEAKPDARECKTITLLLLNCICCSSSQIIVGRTTLAILLRGYCPRAQRDGDGTGHVCEALHPRTTLQTRRDHSRSRRR
ncbi:hypothetical protein cypCar_00038001 [Cyprinus carpio]|nr:hypothetical protein cypCar_00038001 [Cyprinus carpio]